MQTAIYSIRSIATKAQEAEFGIAKWVYTMGCLVDPTEEGLAQYVDQACLREWFETIGEAGVIRALVIYGL